MNPVQAGQALAERARQFQAQGGQVGPFGGVPIDTAIGPGATQFYQEHPYWGTYQDPLWKPRSTNFLHPTWTQQGGAHDAFTGGIVQGDPSKLTGDFDPHMSTSPGASHAQVGQAHTFGGDAELSFLKTITFNQYDPSKTPTPANPGGGANPDEPLATDYFPYALTVSAALVAVELFKK